MMAAALLAMPAQAQNKAEPIDCAESLLYFTDAYKCFATPSSGSGGASVRMFVISGTQGSSFRFLARLQVAEGGAIYQNYSTAQSAEIIRSLAGAVLKSATDGWSAYQGFGSTGYMTFRWNGLQCVGFDHGTGGNKPDGWGMSSGWRMLLQGHFCDGQAIAKPDERLREFLSAIRIGPAKDGQSAMGGSIVAFKSSGGATTAASPKPQAPTTASPSAPAAPVSPAATTQPPAPAPDRGPAAIESDLSVLKTLHDKGLITKEEYDQKRREILGRI
ncbi:SHOCT domain-containing protein [Desertibaculum subflavum]|uniref:SHOCT domain-containing protein n=1 Tax=Desertibaculum subflavum TaxID=2268458 RepID=UPI0013C528F5